MAVGMVCTSKWSTSSYPTSASSMEGNSVASIVSEDNVSYISMMAIPRTGRSTSTSSSRTSSIDYFANIILQALSDFHYGFISIECAESLCSETGEFLIRNGGISENDLRLTVKKQSHHAHFSIYKDQHPFSTGHNIFFLDDKTKQYMFASVLELMQFVVSFGYLPQMPQGSMALHPCGKNKNRVIHSSDLVKKKIVNPNPSSSKTYYAGNYGTLRIVLVTKQKESRVVLEARTRTKFNYHPNIVDLIGVSVSEPVSLVLPEEAQYSLLTHLKSLKPSKTSQMIKICHNVCCGMIYLHSINCLHRSLQSRACIIDQSGMVKISDFDKSCFADSDVIQPIEGEPVNVPTRWAAPEVLNYSEFSKCSDVWSFGVLVWEVFNCGKIPYNDLLNQSLLEKLKPGFRLCLKAKKNSVYDVVLEKCLRYNRNNRPGFDFLESIIQSFL